MEKLIDADTCKEYLKRVLWGADIKIDNWVDSMPAVDAAPVVYGTWGRYYDEYHCTEYIVCSNCGAKYDSDIVFAYHNGEPRLELEGLEHCPHCGAILNVAVSTCGPDYCEIGGGNDADG